MIERYSRPDFRSLWSEEAKYASWAKVERAHLSTLVHSQKAPASVLESFDTAYSKCTVADFLRKEEETGHDVIAFIACVGAHMGQTSPLLHQGLTSSDVVDTALALRVRESLQKIDKVLGIVRKALAQKSFEHSHTICMGRTHGIHAEVQSSLLLALKTIGFAKLSGAVGAYSQLPVAFEKSVLRILELEVEPVATQVVPRDRLNTVAHFMIDLAMATERFATNFRHWARTELGEVTEAFSAKQKGSSAMPHKKNPINAENLCGLARTVRGLSVTLLENGTLWHERDISHSSVERLALPDALTLCDFMAHRLSQLIDNMVVNPAAMQFNLKKLGGLWASQTVLTALVQKGVDRQQAYEALQQVALPLSALASHTALEPDAFAKALGNSTYFSEKLSSSEIDNLFSTERFLACVPAVFQRTFGLVPEEWDRLKTESIESKVPALHRVIHVHVQLNADVLDTETKTIGTHMKKEHIPIQSLRQMRTFVTRLPLGATTLDVQKYALNVLHNAVMENVRLEVVQ
jgi:adenylosuccinate lyase